MWSRELLHIRTLLKRLAIVLLLFSFCRILFYAFNYELFPSLDGWELFSAMLYGLRYDVAAILIINSIFILMHVIPNPLRETRIYQKVLKVQFYIINGGFLILEAGDFIYYEFAQERTSSHILGLRNDIVNLIPQFLLDFWYVLLICLAVFVVVEWLYRKTHIRSGKKRLKISYPMQATLAIAFLLLSFVGVRGGLQEEPLAPQTATKVFKASEVSLVTNTTFTMLHSIINRRLKPVAYFPEKELKEYFQPIQDIEPLPLTDSGERPNVMVILMESFSSEYTGYFNPGKGHTPFLDSLMHESLVFTNAYANGKHSIDAISSVTMGLPALMTDPFINSFYMQNDFKTVAHYLHDLDYYSYFFHGGNYGTMSSDQFLPRSGFDGYFGREEFGDDSYYDGNWGIYDEPFFQYTAEQLNELPKPFFSLFFSLSSHHPFTIPEAHQDEFEEGPHPIHRAVEYADFSLRQFFRSASEMDWFDNTIFIITADHTGPIVEDAYKTRVGHYDVPIVIYAPGQGWKGEVDYTVQHTDILPTVLSLAGYQGPCYGFGQNLLAPSQPSYSVSQMNHIFQLIQGDQVLQFDGNDIVGYYEMYNDPLLQYNLADNTDPVQAVLANRLKGIIQSYVTSLRENEMTPE